MMLAGSCVVQVSWLGVSAAMEPSVRRVIRRHESQRAVEMARRVLAGESIKKVARDFGLKSDTACRLKILRLLKERNNAVFDDPAGKIHGSKETPNIEYLRARKEDFGF